MKKLVTVFQVKADMTREHAFEGLNFMEKQGKDRNAYDMSVYEVVFGETNVEGFVFFPLHAEEIPNFLFEVTNDPSQAHSYKTFVEYFGFKGRSISVSDIIRVGETYYYCDSVGWVEITPKKGSVPHWIQVGMEASGSYYSDSYPFEVTKVTPSGKTVTIRRMDATPAEGHSFGNQEYIYASNPNGQTYTVRRSKYGQWKTPCGMGISFGSARKYDDPHF